MIGASSVGQLEQNVAALDAPELSTEELAEIEGILDGGPDVDLWKGARLGQLGS